MAETGRAVYHSAGSVTTGSDQRQPRYSPMTRALPFPVDATRIAEFCRRHGIVRLSVFGSALRPDFGPSSDVDVLVEFAPGRTPGLAFFSMQDELSGLFGRPVDLQTPGFLSRYFRDRVRADALPLYAA